MHPKSIYCSLSHFYQKVNQMNLVISSSIGYLFGSLNLAALFSKIKKKNLKEIGTGNLGTTNAMLIFGKRYAIWVLFFDILKTVFAVRIAERFFPFKRYSGLAAGASSIIGHIFPFYLHFKGGKGVASLLGLALSMDLFMGVSIIVIGISLMLVLNHAVVWPISVSIMFPIFNGIRTNDLVTFAVSVCIGALIIYMHRHVITDTLHGKEILPRSYTKNFFFKHHKK